MPMSTTIYDRVTHSISNRFELSRKTVNVNRKRNGHRIQSTSITPSHISISISHVIKQQWGLALAFCVRNTFRFLSFCAFYDIQNMRTWNAIRVYWLWLWTSFMNISWNWVFCAEILWPDKSGLYFT